MSARDPEIQIDGIMSLQTLLTLEWLQRKLQGLYIDAELINVQNSQLQNTKAVPMIKLSIVPPKSTQNSISR